MLNTVSNTFVAQPLAQTFTVTHPGGSILTSIGLYFQTRTAAGGSPVTIELRPMTDAGPSSVQYYDGTQVTVERSDVNVEPSTFNSSSETRFTFARPFYAAENTTYAIVVYTSAPASDYKLWKGELGQFVNGSQQQVITKQLNTGSMFESSNGTVWTANQNVDLCFNVYRAKFKTQESGIYLRSNNPPRRALTNNVFNNSLINYNANPLRTTNGSASVVVYHPSHGFSVNDYVNIDGLDSSTSYNGITGVNIIGNRQITAADPFGYTITTGASATATGRVGGSNVTATEQYVVDAFKPNVPSIIPVNTQLEFFGKFTDHKSFANTDQTDYAQSTLYGSVTNNSWADTVNPKIIASAYNETARSLTNPSLILAANISTTDQYLAPMIEINNSTMSIVSMFSDYSDSDSHPLIGTTRNAISTVDFVPETNASGGTNSSKHISIPFTLRSQVANSIRVQMLAERPVGTDFKVWYRVKLGDEININEVDWTQFSTTSDEPNYSNYDDLGAGNVLNDFIFNAYDIDDFDTYQTKITFHSNNSSKYCTIHDIRTAATA